VPVYPQNNTLALLLGEEVADYQPLAADITSDQLIERYELEGELPEGIRFDETTGTFGASLPVSPLPASLDFEVRVRTVNRVLSSDWTTVQVKVTSDM
jgi:hypothetical protein